MSLLITLLKIILGLVAAAFVMLGAALLINRVPLLDSPGLSERLRVYLTTNVAEISDQNRFPELQARDDERDAATLYATTVSAIKKLGWEIITQDIKQHRIEAVVTTGLWKFKDDISIWIETQSTGGSRLYAHSQSRVGRGDLGANTRHLRELVDAVGTPTSISR